MFFGVNGAQARDCRAVDCRVLYEYGTVDSEVRVS